MATPRKSKKAAKKAAVKSSNKPTTKKKLPKLDAASRASTKKAAKTAKKAARTAKKAGKAMKAKVLSKKKGSARGRKVHRSADVELFEPFTEGERAELLRIMAEDRRLAAMAKIGRYRVIAVEPVVVKPPHPQLGHRLGSVVAYDYASNRAVQACIDLDESRVVHLQLTKSQPMLAREEEAAAVAIAMADERVKSRLSFGDEPQVAMHYWSKRETDLAYSRRSAAVVFGHNGARPSVVAIVDLVDNAVIELVAADQW